MPHRVDIHLGAKIRALRTKQGLSLCELAEGIGVSYQQVQKYEKGVNRITARTLFLVCRFLGVTPLHFYADLPEAADGRPPPPAASRLAQTARMLEALPETEVKERLYKLIRALSNAERRRAPEDQLD